MSARNLILILGDQLSLDQASLRGADPEQDVVWMAEVREESTHVWTHKARIVLFLSAMRHFRDALRAEGWTVHYQELTDKPSTLSAELEKAVSDLKPDKLVMTEAGEYRVEHGLKSTAGRLGLDLEILEDDHFLISRAQFKKYAESRKSLRMEYFYRGMRKKYGVLMNDGKPEGGDWNYDSENRSAFPKNGPPLATEKAYRDGRRNISLASAEGFMRQILGWREYVRGIYWTYMPDYIDRMSNYCKGCKYDPSQKTGENARPMTTLYWDFLLRHEDRLKENARMKFQIKNLDRLDEQQREGIQSQAASHRKAVIS